MKIALVVAILLGGAFAQSTSEPSDAAGWKAQGVEFFKQAKYAEAVKAFENALRLDPKDRDARLYLGTTWFVQYIPGANSADNLTYAEDARREFSRVLEIDPTNVPALQYLASLAYQEAGGVSDLEGKLRQLEVARSAYERLTAADPRNTDGWYSLGVIDWLEWYPRWMEALNRAEMKPEDEKPLPEPQRTELRSKFGYLVHDGIENLSRALAVDPQHDASMAYMNLLIRERASLADTAEACAADIATANDWVQRSLAAKRARSADATQDSHGGQLRVSPDLQAERLAARVDPEYPPLAKQARIQGTVRFRATIGVDGHVRNLQLISGHPLLVSAAREAVKQWIYRPVFLNGAPVEVITAIDVNFVLPDARPAEPRSYAWPPPPSCG